MELGNAPSLGDNIVRQLLLSRGVAPQDIDRHLTPTLRNFLPDPSLFRDMDTAADRIAQAVLSGEKITIYGDYDVDGATSSALLRRFIAAVGGRMLQGAARVLIGQFLAALIRQCAGEDAPPSPGWWTRFLRAVGISR